MGTIKASIGEIIVFTADERNNTMGEMRAVTVKENQIYGMTIVLDEDYLADPNTTYPIRIDPTLELVYENAGATALEDVVIQSNNTPLPQYTASVIGKSSKGISRLLVRFPGIDFYAMEGVTVTSAYLSIRDLLCEAESMTLTCYPFTGSEWTETTANWSMTQSWGAELDCQTVSYYNGVNNDPAHYYYFDIADVVQDWVDGTADPDKGILFKASDAVENGTTLESRVFASYERDSYKPIFTMVYNNAVSITPVEAEVYVGETVSLTAVTAPANLAVTWESLNEAVALVDENGVVTGIAPGTAIITAELEDGACASCVVTVLAKSITLNPTSLEVYVGQAKTITVATQPIGEDVDWRSENSAVATVEHGTVIGVSAGSTNIVAELDDGTVAYCTVTVLTKSVSLIPTSMTVYKGETVALEATTVPVGENLVWTSTHDSVATVVNGVVTTVGAGQTVIRAAINSEVFAECTLTVKVFSLVQTVANVDETDTITLQVEDGLLPGRSVEWTSANPSVASVNSAGCVTGVIVGMTTITASIAENISATCTMWVTIPDGVYQIKNVANDLFLDTRSGGYIAGTAIQQYTEATNYYRNQLFKITYLNQYNYYSIRPMTNSGMGISAPVTGNKEDVTIEAISTTDSMDTIPYEQCWRIMKSDQNYMLRNGNRGGSGYLTSSASDIAGKQVTADSYTSGYSEWELIPYEGSDLQGIVLVEKPTEILCGNSFDFDAFMFSSVIGCNGPVEYSIGSYGNTITDTASINSTTGNLHALDIGEVKVRFNFDGCPLTWGYTIDIVQAGCRTYRYIEARSTESYNINCHGYAFGVDDVPGGWYTYAEDLFATYSTISSNELLYGLDAFSGMKALLEIYWLDEVFSGRWEEVYSYDDGWDIELDDNQWLVVFRVGKHGTAWDYHFWYRTDTGKWANKHGWRNGSGSELLGDMPSDDASPGWAAGVYEFYDSDIIYYVVTMED